MMIECHNSRPAAVIDPTGRLLTVHCLPPPDTRRWVASRKAQVVLAVENGLLTLDQVLERYNLSREEFASWQRAMNHAGVSGLRVAWVRHERAVRRRSGPAHLRLVPG